MRIIQNNYRKQTDKSRRCTCSECGSVFEYEDDDCRVGAYGLFFVTCPCCKCEISLDDGIELTEDNVHFPDHYYHFGKDLYSHVEDAKVDEYVRTAIQKIREDHDDYVSISSGDTMVFVARINDEDNYFVYVGQDGYETNIPFQEIDYKED